MKLLQSIAQRIMGNGMKVICLRKHDAPVIAMQVWYRTGSVNEDDGQKGISHIVEHMMFRGSEHVGPEEHARRVNEVGGHCNAFTAEDVTAFVNAVPRQSFPEVLELEADRMRGLLFDPAILETERKVIIEEFHGYMNNPVTKAFLEFRKKLFGDHPYALSPLGILEDIQGITSDQCRGYFRKWYRPSNAVCVVVGDFEHEDAAFDMVEKTLGQVPNPADELHKSSDTVPARGSTVHRMEEKIDFDVPLLVLGYPGPSSSDSDALGLEILQMILSQGQTSRLHRRLVRQKGIAVMAGGMNHFIRLAGMSLFFAIYTPDISRKRVEKALSEEIRLLRDGGVSELELEKVKNASLTNRLFEIHSAEHLCQKIGYAELVEGDYRNWVRRLDTLEKITLNQVTEAAGRYWNEPERYTLALSPRKVPVSMYLAGILRRIVSWRKK